MRLLQWSNILINIDLNLNFDTKFQRFSNIERPGRHNL
jgi:hypothetical protein